jgi:hypothetical protein
MAPSHANDANFDFSDRAAQTALTLADAVRIVKDELCDSRCPGAAQTALTSADAVAAVHIVKRGWKRALDINRIILSCRRVFFEQQELQQQASVQQREISGKGQTPGILNNIFRIR